MEKVQAIKEFKKFLTQKGLMNDYIIAFNNYSALHREQNGRTLNYFLKTTRPQHFLFHGFAFSIDEKWIKANKEWLNHIKY
jgi:hypothetical protein